MNLQPRIYSITGNSELQEMVYYGKLTDRETDIPAFLMSHFKALPRYNPRITATEGDDAGVQLPLIQKLTPLASDQLNYLHQPGTEDAIKAITHWIVVDLTSQVPHRGSAFSINKCCWTFSLIRGQLTKASLLITVYCNIGIRYPCTKKLDYLQT